MSETNEEFDGLLMTVIQKARGIDNYFDAVFGFLFRKTDFFSNEVKSREIMDIQFKKYLNKYQDKIERERKIKERKEKEQAALNKPTEASSATVKELTPEEYLKKKKSKSKSKKKTKSKNTNEFNTTHSLILKTEERPIKSRYIFNKEKIKANKLKIKPINKTKKNNRSNNHLSLSMEKRANKDLDNFKSDSTKEKKILTKNSMEKRPINKIKNINVQNKKIKNKNIKNYSLNRTPDNKSMTVNSSGKASSTNIKGKNNKTVCNEQKLNINEATHLEQSIGEDESLVTIDDVIDEELKELEKDEENIILLMEQIKNLSNELEEK